jgi:hypothetical protein
MPDKIMLDASVIDAILRGNRGAARALRKMIDSGATIHIGNWQYGELTGDPGKIGRGPDSPQTRAANKKVLDELKIGVLPLTGKVTDRAKVHDRFGEHAGLAPGDYMLLAEAWANGYEVFSYDKVFRNQAEKIKNAYGVRVRQESISTYKAQLGKHDLAQARRNLGLKNRYLVLPNGRMVKLPKKGLPSGSGGRTGSSGGPPSGPSGAGTSGSPASGQPGPKATTGAPDKGPAVLDSPSQTKGQKIADGAELVLAGVNFVVQAINDRIQANRMKEQWDKIRPNVERRLAEDPTLGALILVRYFKRRKQGPEHESPLEHTNLFDRIDVAYGANASEALANYRLQSRIGKGGPGDVDTQTFFMPPKKPTDIRDLRTPFPAYGVGTFVPGRASLMQVRWGNITGFNEKGDVKLKVPDDVSPRFLLLHPPGEILFRNGPTFVTEDIPLDLRDAGSTEPHFTRAITVVDMDAGLFDWGSDAAAMVFPADPATERLFHGVAKTQDSFELNKYVNFDKVRWVRPENIHVLRKFMEEDDKIESSKSSRPSSIQMKPQEDPVAKPRQSKP